MSTTAIIHHFRRTVLFGAIGSLIFSPGIVPAIRAQAPLPRRVSWQEFSQDAAKVAAFERGIKELKHRSEVNKQDTLGWLWEANTHQTEDDPPDAANPPPEWNGCEHHTKHFLDWHRGYLYYFERILRDASGDSQLMLPYWNWDDPAQRALPAEFRDKINHPYLFQEGRQLNAPHSKLGVAVDPASAFNRLTLLRDSPFVAGFSFALENPPHDTVHVQTGGIMGSPATAARDPIFWLHHCNIDRLWEKWLAKPGHGNPSATEWGNPTFWFRDEQRHLLQKHASEVNNAAALGYAYADPPPSTGPQNMSNPASSPAPAPALSPDPTIKAVAVAASSEKLVVTQQTLSTSLTISQTKMTEAMSDPAAAAGHRVAVTLKDVVQPAPAGCVFLVYLHRAAPEAFNPKEAVQIGVVAIFGGARAKQHSHGATDLVFDATDAVKKLTAVQGSPLESLRVSVVPQAGETSDGGTLPVSPDARLEIGKIELQILTPGTPAP